MTPIREIRFNNLTYRLPFAHLFRPHTADERAALAAEVAELGVLNRIVTYDSDRFGQRCVIDGICRLEISAAQGRSIIPAHHRGPLPDERAQREAVSLNVARRHLSPEEMAAYREKRNADIVADRLAGDSLQVIAERFGLHRDTIHSILEQWKRTATVGCPTVPEMVTGVDGIQRPSTGNRTADPERRFNSRLVGVLSELLEGERAGRLHAVCLRHRLDDEGEAKVRAVLADLVADAAQPAPEVDC